MSLPTGFRAYAASVGIAALATMGWLVAGEPTPPLGTLALFCALVLYSSHRSVEFAEGSFVNADFMVMMAAVVAFSDTSPLLGPAIVAVARGLYLPELRRKAWSLISLNAGSGLFAIVCAALIGMATGTPRDGAAALIAALLEATICVAVLWLTLAPAFVLRGQPFRTVVASFAPRALESVPFSALGYFVGLLYLGIGGAAVLMLIVPMFIAREVFASYIRVKESHEETVQMLIRALEAKDKYTSGHSERVATYARYIGEELNFMPARMERLRFAALMHDIGKLVVPNQLLNKPGRLTEEEFAKVRLHEKVSVQMLSHIDFLRPIAAATHGDNMKFIPDDDAHPIEPYIVMIADAYDAMTSTRSYRKALPQEVAFQELRDKAGIQFHPACAEALIHAIEKRDEKHGAGYEVQDEFLDAPEAGLGSAGLGDLLPSDAQ
jgi:hypothetical protein